MIFQAQTNLVARKEVAEKTIEVSFARPENFEFAPGQYVQIVVPKLRYADQRGVSRLFSIASSPNQRERITIAFRDSGSGYKRTLTESSLGYEVIVKGPFGRDFNLSKDTCSRIVFIAGGVGITPFLSMITFASEEKISLPITLLYGNRNKKSAAYLNELEALGQANKNIRIINKFGRIDEKFIQENASKHKGAAWYIAGPPAMVDYTKDTLCQLKIDPQKIHTERFTGY